MTAELSLKEIEATLIQRIKDTLYKMHHLAGQGKARESLMLHRGYDELDYILSSLFGVDKDEYAWREDGYNEWVKLKGV